jgi:hypothetical protein
VDSGFQAEVANPMQWLMHTALQMSFASDTVGNEIGEGIGTMIGGQSGGARDRTAKSNVSIGDDTDVAEPITGRGAGILTGG